MRQTSFVFFLLGFLPITAFYIPNSNNANAAKLLQLLPEIRMTTPEIIQTRGYKSESHFVTTEDDYILEIHRIPAPSLNATPVLLMHGVLVSSSSWVINYGNHSLGCVLANEGYDVWLGNFRGNEYGNRHVHYTQADGRFWQYGLDESGLYDAPAIVDYILNVTGHSKLAYIGHSMGTTSFFMMTSAKPTYNQKVTLNIPGMYIASTAAILFQTIPLFAQISAMFALSPVFFITKPRGGLATAISIFKKYNFPAEAWRQPMPPNAAALRNVVSTSCTGNTANSCLSIVSFLAGYTGPHVNVTRLPLYLSHYFATTSLRTFAQFAQWTDITGNPTKYNWGEKGNTIKYGQATPPTYDPSKITAPVFIYYSDGDFFTHPLDINELANKLPNLQSLQNVPAKTYSHFDFMFGWDGKEIYYDHILQNLHS